MPRASSPLEAGDQLAVVRLRARGTPRSRGGGTLRGGPWSIAASICASQSRRASSGLPAPHVSPAARATTRRRRRSRGRRRPPWRGSSRRRCGARCRRPPRSRRSSRARSRARRTAPSPAGRSASRVRCFLRSRSPAVAMSATLAVLVTIQRNSAYRAKMQWLHFCTSCAKQGMALLLGRLAGAAAHHWKRSPSILVAVLAVLAVLASTGGGFSDDFSTPGTESQRRIRPPVRPLPGPVRRHRHRRLLGPRRDAADGARGDAIAGAVQTSRRQPHVTGGPIR